MSDSPDQATMASPTVQTSTYQPFKPKAPIMGGILQVSGTEYCAWTGGKPKADWSGLNDAAATAPAEDYQLRPSSPGSAQKSTAYREKGVKTKFKEGDNLVDFVRVTKEYLKRTGMDTIAYLADPNNATEMLNE